jgi:N-acetylglucosaminyldiphosphoundecaprenol N-acetyl-beta-D-mannosaminyltransferase
MMSAGSSTQTSLAEDEVGLGCGSTGVFRVLGVRVNAVQIPEVVAILERWIRERQSSRYVAVTGMHGVTESRRDPDFRVALDAADLVVPDGMPLVWLGRYHGMPLQRRVYGPELMATFMRRTGGRYRHFFYGGAPGVADRLAQHAQDCYGIRIAGTFCPPFCRLTPEEDAQILKLIHCAEPDVVWIGLSTPKQERWMYEHRESLKVPVMLGVGAAFDINSGTLRQAPMWMRENGLEWLFRLMTEPRWLWRRYLVNGSEFVWNVLLEVLCIKTF